MFYIICLAGLAGAFIGLILIFLAYFKDKSLLVPYIIFFAFIAVFGVSAFLDIRDVGATAEEPPTESSEAPSAVPSEDVSETNAISSDLPQPSESFSPANVAGVVFDAQQFMFIDSTTGNYLTVSEKELIEMIGEPENIDEWNYKINGMVYPIRSLLYADGNYVYEFNNDHLVRIQIFEEIPYTDKSELLGMFNLKREPHSEVVDTGMAYRVYNCIVNDLWCTFNDDGTIYSTYISYADLF